MGGCDNAVDPAEGGAGAREAEESANFALELRSWFARFEGGLRLIELIREGGLSNLVYWGWLTLDDFEEHIGAESRQLVGESKLGV